MIRGSVKVLATVVALLSGLGGQSALAKSPAHPTQRDQALRDGCQRSALGIGFDTTPEWVYVYRDPTIREAEGITRVAHASLEDSILQHASYDFNASLVPDSPFRYLVAGGPRTHTNNYSPGGGEEFARLHYEWESGMLPFWAWPTDGDRTKIWGSWIWDCGHWTTVENDQGGAITGEHSELHPLNAIAVTRHEPFRSRGVESDTDVFISNDGTGAHAVEQCALSHHPASSTAYDPGFTTCSENPANRGQPLLRHYSFFVPAPPRPSPGARLRYRIVSHVPGRAGTERVAVRADGLSVTVTMAPDASSLARYGKSFFVRWDAGSTTAPTPVRVTLQSILIKRADPNPSVPDPTPPPWTMYLNVNGDWQYVNDWAPRLYGVHNGERIKIGRSLTVYVPAGGRLWFQLGGRECDEPSGTTLFGVAAGLVHPCPANSTEINPNIFELLSNDDAGTVLDVYRSVQAAIGTHTRTSAGTVRVPGTGRIDFGNAGEGHGTYVLTYSVSRAATPVPARRPAFTG